MNRVSHLVPLLMKRIPLGDLCCHLWRMYLVTLWNSIQSFIHMCLSQKSLWSISQLCFFWIPDNLVIPLVTDHRSTQILPSGSLLKSKVNSKINWVSVYWENSLPQQSFEATPKGGNGVPQPISAICKHVQSRLPLLTNCFNLQSADLRN